MNKTDDRYSLNGLLHWEVKSQETFTVFWAIVNDLMMALTQFEVEETVHRNCASVDINDFLTDRIVTYTNP